MIEAGKRVEEYLSGLSMTGDSKQKYRKAIAEFLALLRERGKITPDSSDYSDYQERLTESASEATAKDRVNKARKYFAWLEASSVEGVKGEKRKDDKARFSLMLSPLLREKLELLAQFRRCSVTEILTGLAEKCVTENARDIESMREFYRMHSAKGNRTL